VGNRNSAGCVIQEDGAFFDGHHRACSFTLPRSTIRHKRGIQRYKCQAGRHAMLSERAASSERSLDKAAALA
jgi:hypothetical protein